MTTKTTPSIQGYELLGVLGHGGQATVHTARRISDGRLVAIKLPHARTMSEATLRRFGRERMALERISHHPAIVSLLATGFADDGCPYLVMDYVGGGTLAQRVANAPLDVDEATAMAVTTAGALGQAHAAGILHRDVKPHNVLAAGNGTWKLSDFGIATLTDIGPATQSVQVSFAHSAPEAFEPKGSSAASDVYSLASTLFTSLSGREPFARGEGEVAASTLRRMLLDPAPDLGLQGVPESLAQLLTEAMSKDPADRPRSALAFARRLNEVRVDLGLAPVAMALPIEVEPAGATREVSPPPDLDMQPAPPPADPSRRRWRPVANAVAAVAVSAIALVGLGGAVGDVFNALPPAGALFDVGGGGGRG